MDYLKAIEIRKSRRNYLNKPLDSEKLKIIKNLISKCNSSGGLSIRFIEDGRDAFGLGKDYGMFSGVKSLIAMTGRSSDLNLREKVGYYGEMLVLEATALGLGTCWVGGSFGRKSDIFSLDRDESLIAVITIGDVRPESGLKERFIQKLIHRKTKSLGEFYLSDTDNAVPDWFISGIKAVQKAPSAINRQPVKFEYKTGDVTAYVDNPSEFELIDLGIAKLHFEIATSGHFELGNHALLKRN